MSQLLSQFSTLQIRINKGTLENLSNFLKATQ